MGEAVRRRRTRTEPFMQLGRTAKPMPLMPQQAPSRVAEAGGVKAIELAHMFDEIAMVVPPPEDAKGLPGLEGGLDTASLPRWLRRLGAAAQQRCAAGTVRPSERKL